MNDPTSAGLTWRQRLWAYPLAMACGAGFAMLVAVIQDHVSVMIH